MGAAPQYFIGVDGIAFYAGHNRLERRFDHLLVEQLLQLANTDGKVLGQRRHAGDGHVTVGFCGCCTALRNEASFEICKVHDVAMG
ncbi:hypothetical protein GCM10007052_12580 [Halioglobus japonicus]|nr:hypothetical protein GCM10007052_12580 [Halioglobus japonicus]